MAYKMCHLVLCALIIQFYPRLCPFLLYGFRTLVGAPNEIYKRGTVSNIHFFIPNCFFHNLHTLICMFLYIFSPEPDYSPALKVQFLIYLIIPLQSNVKLQIHLIMFCIKRLYIQWYIFLFINTILIHRKFRHIMTSTCCICLFYLFNQFHYFINTGNTIEKKTL